jgi:transcriptional regulator with XRE-family HTH domain
VSANGQIHLGQTITQVRQERNLTQEELGELIGVKKVELNKRNNYEDCFVGEN